MRLHSQGQEKVGERVLKIGGALDGEREVERAVGASAGALEEEREGTLTCTGRYNLFLFQPHGQSRVSNESDHFGGGYPVKSRQHPRMETASLGNLTVLLGRSFLLHTCGTLLISLRACLLSYSCRQLQTAWISWGIFQVRSLVG